MTLRRFLPLVLILPALLFTAGLNGCATLQAASDAPVTIRYAFWGTIYEIPVWEKLAERFHAHQNRVRVKLEHISGQAYHPKLMAMTVGRCAPDVMAVDDEPYPELAENLLFEDLGPWIERDQSIDPDDLYPQFFKAWIHRRKSYAIPYLGHCLVIYYNKAHFRSAGLPEPAADWTWDDFLRYAKALTQDLDGDGRLDRFGFMRPFSLYYSLPWVWMAGGNEYDPPMTRCTLNTPESVEAIRFLSDLTHRHRVTPLTTELPGMPLENMFLTGHLGMVVHGPWWLQNCRREPGLEWDIQHFPIGPRGQRSTRTTCEGLAISVQSTHKEEAWQWIRFVVGEEGQQIIGENDRGMPARRAVAERVFPKPNTPQHEERLLEAMKYARVQRIPVQFGENNIAITREWDLMLLGKRTPEQVAANIERDVNRILGEGR
jgi:multiple sugar transport system substrate-binding protein